MVRFYAASRALLILALVSGALVPPVLAEDPVESVALRLEVSREGQPVRGLTADDFRIRVAGRTRKVVKAVEVPTDVATMGLPAGAYRHFLFLFDLELTSPQLVVSATDLAEEVLSQSLLPSDRVAILTHHPAAGLEARLEPTADRTQIRQALELLQAEQRGLISGSSDVGPRVNAEDLINARHRDTESAKGIVQQAQGRISRLVRTLSILEHAARPFPGGSQVVLFSEGFDSSVILGSGATARLDQALASQQSEAAVQGQISAVNSASRFTGGVVETELFEVISDYKQAGVPIQSIRMRPEGHARPVDRGSQGPNGLSILSEKTGGAVFANTDDAVRQLSARLQPIGSIYLLTIERADSPQRDRYRRLDVRLKNSDGQVQLLAPPGYFVP